MVGMVKLAVKLALLAAPPLLMPGVRSYVPRSSTVTPAFTGNALAAGPTSTGASTVYSIPYG
jgi:hypothetical protein